MLNICTHFAFYCTHFASYFSLKFQHYFVIKLPKIHQTIKYKLTKGLWYTILVLSRYATGALMVKYGWYINLLLRGTVFSCTLEVQQVHYYCSVEVFTIKFHPSAYFALLGKIDSPFCLQNCLFLLAAYFARNSASKFCQGLVHRVGTGGGEWEEGERGGGGGGEGRGRGWGMTSGS